MGNAIPRNIHRSLMNMLVEFQNLLRYHFTTKIIAFTEAIISKYRPIYHVKIGTEGSQCNRGNKFD